MLKTTRSPCAAALTLMLAFISSGCVIVSANINPFGSSPEPLDEHEVSGSGRERIVLLDITGPITSHAGSSTFGLASRESTVTKVDAVLRKAREDDRVRAVVLRINSPGGTVTASDVLYDQVKRFKSDTGIPVIAEIQDVGASGAYYAALAADEIVAHPTSVIGSIGVVLQSVNVTGLMSKIGVTNQTIATGEMKDIGSPLSEMTSEERRVLQSVVDDMYDRFLALVRQNRTNLTEEMDRQMQDGRIFSAPQALAGGLVDRLEYLEETIEHTKRRIGLQDATVVVYRQPDALVRGIYSRANPAPVQVNLLSPDIIPSSPQLLYQWLP